MSTLGRRSGLLRRRVARGAAEVVEARRPRLHIVVVGVAHRRHGQRAGVERHAAQPVVGDLGLATVGRRSRTRSGSRYTSPVGNSDDVMPMSPLNAPAACASTVGHVRLPSEATELESARCAGSTRVRPTGDPVAVLVVGVGGADDVGLRNRFEQTDADHLRSEPRRDRGCRRRADRMRDPRSRRSAPAASTPCRRRTRPESRGRSRRALPSGWTPRIARSCSWSP